MKKNLFFILTFLCFSLRTLPSHALVVNSDINSDTHWTIADSPVVVSDSDFQIDKNSTLTIDAGVTVKFSGSVTVYGTILANGVSGNHIVFTEVNGGDKWGFFSFERNACTDPETHSLLQYVDFEHMNSYIYFSKQSGTIDHSTISISGSLSYGVHSYNDNLSACDATMEITNSTLNITSSYVNPVGKAYGLLLDGMDMVFTGNTLNTTITGEVFEANSLSIYISNTHDFSINVDNNQITHLVTNDDIIRSYGIYVKDAGAIGNITNNTVDVTAHNEIGGIKATGGRTISGNTITGTSTSLTTTSVERKAYGIYSDANDGTAIISNNQISLDSDVERYLVGVFCQNASVSNNNIILTLTGGTGYAMGLTTRYYDPTIVNNSVSMSMGAGLYTYGIYYDTHNVGHTTYLKNNIFRGNGGANSYGIYKDDLYTATIAHSYNLFHNIHSNYNGVSAGTGEITSDPLFVDPDSDLHIQAGSPALDAGDWDSSYASEPALNGGRINIGSYGNTAAARTTLTLVAPEISTHSGVDYTQNNSSLTLEGRTSSASNQILVNNSSTGVTYTAGQTSWSYNGTLALGDNIFNVKAVDGSDNQSATDSITVNYTDNVLPTVSSVSPAGGSTDVEIDSEITATFSENMDPATLTTSTFTLSGGVVGSVSLAGNVATFSPSSNLAHGTLYTATITTGAKDLSNNGLGANYTWTFTTVSELGASGGGDSGGGSEEDGGGGDTNGNTGDSDNHSSGDSNSAPAAGGCSLRVSM